MHIPIQHALALLFVSAAATAQITSAPCFETSLGTNLSLGDDQVAQGIALGFTFPGPAGPVTTIDISSNGFVWLAPNSNSACCSGDVNGFLTDLPRIAAMWTDLYPPGGNGVFFNSFVNVPNSTDRAVITWDATELGGAGPFVVQLQLLATGAFTIAYDANVDNWNHACLIGVSAGNGATQNGIDFSGIAGVYNSGTNPTIHEDFTQTFDLIGKSYEFLPNGNGGYLVFERTGCRLASSHTYGRGCPQPLAVYEFFPQTTVDLSARSLQFLPSGTSYAIVSGQNLWFNGFTNNLNLTDDSVATVALPFPFPHSGGIVSSIDVSSNGFVWLATNSNSACCTGNVLDFLSDLPRIAPLWMDLNPSNGGGVFADLDPATGEFVVTWNNVPEYPNNPPVTMQLALQSSGIFELRYQTVGNLTHDALTGYSAGNGAPDPGSVDYSLLPIVTAGGGPEPMLDVQAGSAPRLNTTLVQELSNLPNNALLVGYVMSLSSATVDLTPIGMPGCTGLVDFFTPGASVVLFFPVTPPMLTFNLTVPNDPAIIGFTTYGQAVALASGFNAIGVIASNGIELDFGR